MFDTYTTRKRQHNIIIISVIMSQLILECNNGEATTQAYSIGMRKW
jgi:hypothetical protein